VADPRPDLGPHVSHDLELIARVAAGDGSDNEFERASELVRACAECRALEADLRTITSSVRALGSADTGVRAPRDFRLTTADAARLRPRAGLHPRDGLRATLREAFGSVRGRVGSGFIAIGIIGIVLGGSLAGQPPEFRAAGVAPTAEKSDAKGPVTGAIGIDPAATGGDSLVNGAAPTSAPTSQASIDGAPSSASTTNVVVFVFSGLLIVAGLALLLSAGRRRRAGP
jgi:hypothetical protein